MTLLQVAGLAGGRDKRPSIGIVIKMLTILSTQGQREFNENSDFVNFYG
ncbi:hypothetical protein GRF61_23230 [Azoarcus sp. TTM-91]|nr:hypothetical protein [Azoarcus sp. TTM-91]NMG37372.1 hypothetical protein [Azoarcus sp. TTM-91]